jgi:hypothetical protein
LVRAVLQRPRDRLRRDERIGAVDFNLFQPHRWFRVRLVDLWSQAASETEVRIAHAETLSLAGRQVEREQFSAEAVDEARLAVLRKFAADRERAADAAAERVI